MPETAWFNQVLLYWDEVKVIIPQALLDSPAALDGYTRELIDVELITPTRPDYHVHRLTDFTDGFLQLLATDAPSSGKATGRGRQRIHFSKLGEGLARELTRRDLASRARLRDGHYWLEVEARTAQLFAAYLAQVMAHLPGNRPMRLVSDSSEHLAVFGAQQSNHQLDIFEEQQIRTRLLEGVLPAPAVGTSPSELRDFKAENAGRLVRFRRRVDRAVRQALDRDQPSLREDEIAHELADLEDDLRDLQETMSARGWHPRLSSVCGVALAGAALQSVVAGAPVGAATGVAIVAAAQAALGQRFAPQDWTRDPLAYAVLASRRFGSNAG